MKPDKSKTHTETWVNSLHWFRTHKKLEEHTPTMQEMDDPLTTVAVSSTHPTITRAVVIETFKYTEITGLFRVNKIWCESKATLIYKTGKILDVAPTMCLGHKLY